MKKSLRKVSVLLHAISLPPTPLGGGLVGVNRCGNNKSFRFIVERSETSHGMFTSFKKLIAFSLVELMISLITISCIAAAFTPVITKKLKKQDVALSLAQTSEISDVCGKDSGKNFGNNTDGYNCKLCTKAYCIQCGLTDCGEGNYIDQKSCTCKNCKTDAGLNNCTSCKIENSTAVCTACEIGNGTAGTGYYLKKEGSGEISKTCKKCDSGYFCEDGIVEKKQSTCQNPPSGYVCRNNKLFSCSQVYDVNCGNCDNSKCTKCTGFYHLSGTECIRCGGPNACSSCRDDNPDYCTACSSDRYLDNGVCKLCDPNCAACSGSSKNCTACPTGSTLTAQNTCSTCNIQNCVFCKDKSSPMICETCLGGYYPSGSTCASCSSKFGSNCTVCNSTRCLSCKIGYYLKNPTSSTACAVNNQGFNCSDNTFMRLGDICITRRNMGDATSLKIPATVDILDARSDYCFGGKGGRPCCYVGATTNETSCTNKFGIYSSCKRTACNYKAAVEICSNFKYAGRNWRLPTRQELDLMKFATVGYGPVQGLGLCVGRDFFGEDFCSGGPYCMGSRDANYCYLSRVVGQGYVFTLHHGDFNQWKNTGGLNTETDDMPGSVRCVTEIE